MILTKSALNEYQIPYIHSRYILALIPLSLDCITEQAEAEVVPSSSLVGIRTKVRVDKSPSDKMSDFCPMTGQVSTGQDRSEQVKTGHDWSGQGWTGQDR